MLNNIVIHFNKICPLLSFFFNIKFSVFLVDIKSKESIYFYFYFINKNIQKKMYSINFNVKI